MIYVSIFSIASMSRLKIEFSKINHPSEFSENDALYMLRSRYYSVQDVYVPGASCMFISISL